MTTERFAAIVRARHEAGTYPAVRLETAPGAWPALRAAWPRLPAVLPPPDHFSESVREPTGMLIVENPGLPEGTWRMVDTDGTVSEEGIIRDDEEPPG